MDILLDITAPNRTKSLMFSQSKILDFGVGIRARRPVPAHRHCVRILFFGESTPTGHYRAPVFPLYLTGELAREQLLRHAADDHPARPALRSGRSFITTRRLSTRAR
jgi:hypothetical protein